MVPLYVSFGDETFRDYVDITPDEFYARLKDASQAPKSSQPTPADFAAVYEELAGYEHVLAVMLSSKLSGTCESARLGAESAGDSRVTVIDSGVTSGGTVILADAIQRRLQAGTTMEEIDALVERFKRLRGLLFTVETLEYLVRGGPGRQGGRSRGPAPLRQAHPRLRRRRGRPAQTRPRPREGAGRVRAALPRGHRGLARPARRRRPRSGPAGRRRPSSRACAPRARTPRSTSSRRSAP